jgi:hypothetical protein
MRNAFEQWAAVESISPKAKTATRADSVNLSAVNIEVASAYDSIVRQKRTFGSGGKRKQILRAGLSPMTHV